MNGYLNRTVPPVAGDGDGAQYHLSWRGVNFHVDGSSTAVWRLRLSGSGGMGIANRAATLAILLFAEHCQWIGAQPAGSNVDEVT